MNDGKEVYLIFVTKAYQADKSVVDEVLKGEPLTEENYSSVMPLFDTTEDKASVDIIPARESSAEQDPDKEE